MKLKNWLDLKKDRCVDIIAELATSEDEALAYCAARILRYRSPKGGMSVLLLSNCIIASGLSLILLTSILRGDLFDMAISGFAIIISITYLRLLREAVKSAQDPRYDWAEDYRDIVEEWRAQRYIEKKRSMRMADFHALRRWR